jgi:hypothetical protein
MTVTYVLLAASEDMVRIGRTENLARRLVEHRNGNTRDRPFPDGAYRAWGDRRFPTLAFAIEGDVERLLTTLFADDHYVGSWYHRRGELARWVWRMRHSHSFRTLDDGTKVVLPEGTPFGQPYLWELLSDVLLDRAVEAHRERTGGEPHDCWAGDAVRVRAECLPTA